MKLLATQGENYSKSFQDNNVKVFPYVKVRLSVIVNTFFYLVNSDHNDEISLIMICHMQHPFSSNE